MLMYSIQWCLFCLFLLLLCDSKWLDAPSAPVLDRRPGVIDLTAHRVNV